MSWRGGAHTWESWRGGAHVQILSWRGGAHDWSDCGIYAYVHVHVGVVWYGTGVHDSLLEQEVPGDLWEGEDMVSWWGRRVERGGTCVHDEKERLIKTT